MKLFGNVEPNFLEQLDSLEHTFHGRLSLGAPGDGAGLLSRSSWVAFPGQANSLGLKINEDTWHPQMHGPK